MLDYIMTIRTNYPELFTLIYAGVTAGSVALLWQLLKNFIHFIKNTFVISLTVSLQKELNYYAGYQQRAFEQLLSWLSNYKGIKYSKSAHYVGYNSNNKENIFGVGFGSHFIIYKFRLFIITMRKIEAVGTAEPTSELIIKTIGFSKQPIFNLLNDILVFDNSEIVLVDWLNEGYKYVKLDERDIDTVILNKELKQEIIQNIDKFIESEPLYKKSGIPHKMGIVLYGKPGTGKTSLIKAIATKYRFSVHTISLNNISEDNLKGILSFNDKSVYNIIVFEDIDVAKATHNRDKSNNDNTSNKQVDLAGILNTLDGLADANNMIFIATTNHIQKLDPALLRAGRFDYHYELDYFNYDEVQQYAQLMFNSEIQNLPKDINIAPCNLQKILLNTKFNKENFEKELLQLVKRP